ncbi:MAG: AraC family transcriptional regulator [Hyphomicrobiaceae bacterium]|nr:AraC family transcriptional regulator [Hyphomicrobiaceae bacterium]
MDHLLRRHHLIETTNPGQMEAVLRSAFGARQFEVRSTGPDFAAGASHWNSDATFSLAFASCDADVDVEFPESDLVRVYFGLHGTAQHHSPAGEGHLHAGTNLIIGSDLPVRSRLHSGIRQLVLRIQQEGLCRVLEQLAGRGVRGRIEFDVAAPGVQDMLGSTRRLVEILTQHLDQPTGIAPAIFERELVQTIQVALVTEVPHNFSRLLSEPLGQIPRSKVQRAEAFIEANWDQPLSIEAVAREAGCSVRSLFKAFQSERDYTPIIFLRRKRLERAHGMLLDPRSDTSVAAVAAACGFSNAGHFARYYRKQYGVLPSLTLRIGRGR